MTLNLKSPEGPELLRRLADRADVLVESFRPGVMHRLGVGLERALRAQPTAGLLRDHGLRPGRARTATAPGTT